MKKVLLILIFVTTAIFVSQAQIYVGPKAGLNLSYMSDGMDAEEGTKEPLKIGYNFGIAGQVDLDKFFSLYGDFGYSLKGNKITFGDESVKFNYHYVQLAILPRVVIDQDIIRYYVNAGPTLGWLLGGTANYMGSRVKMQFVDADEYMAEVKELLFLRDNTNRLEASLSAGGGMLIAAGQGEFVFDLRYDWGLTNIREDYLPNGKKAKNKNNVISVSIGYMFAADGR